MSQFSHRKPQNEYERSEPRPPIPGKESRRNKVGVFFRNFCDYFAKQKTVIDD